MKNLPETNVKANFQHPTTLKALLLLIWYNSVFRVYFFFEGVWVLRLHRDGWIEIEDRFELSLKDDL